jgi:hypothetical protein
MRSPPLERPLLLSILRTGACSRRGWSTERFVFVPVMPYSETRVDQTRTLSDIGSWLVKFFEWFGNLALFCGRLIRSTVTPPYEVGEFFHQFDELGSKSLPLVALAGAATGIVLTLSTRLPNFRRIPLRPAYPCQCHCGRYEKLPARFRKKPHTADKLRHRSVKIAGSAGEASNVEPGSGTGQPHLLQPIRTGGSENPEETEASTNLRMLSFLHRWGGFRITPRFVRNPAGE